MCVSLFFLSLSLCDVFTSFSISFFSLPLCKLYIYIYINICVSLYVFLCLPLFYTLVNVGKKWCYVSPVLCFINSENGYIFKLPQVDSFDVCLEHDWT